MAIIKLNNNALTSVTELPSGVGADPNVKTDLARLGLRVFANQNLAKQNSNSLSYDVFQDATGIQNLTNATRDSDESIFASSTGTDSSVKFLINQDTSSGSTTFTDATGNHTISAGGDPVWSNSYAKWGSNSIYFDGNDWLEIADNNDWYYGNSGNGWTFECWWYTLPNFQDGFIWYQGTDTSNGNPRNHIYISGDTTISFYDQVASNGGDAGASFSETTPTFTSNWRHIALVFDDSANQLQFAIDGTWLGSARSYANPSNNSNAVKIGRGQNSSGNRRYLYGHLDGLKISAKKVYTLGTNFTPPTSQFDDQETTQGASGSFEGVDITAPNSVTKMGAVITYTETGSNTLNTDIILKLSADSGSNFSTATLTPLPDFATGVKCASVTDLSVTSGTALTYKIEFANQSNSKNAKITGVSLQY
tara:strand:- start:1424 stop:2686 length:1263 start_codon:yes stop_codon:yes gene_type:complete